MLKERIMNYLCRYIVIFFAITTPFMHGMLAKKLGSIDKRLIVRHARLRSHENILKRFRKERCEMRYDASLDGFYLREYPCLKFKLLFTRDPKLLSDSTTQYLFAHSCCSSDQLTEEIFDTIDGIEKKFGYIPEYRVYIPEYRVIKVNDLVQITRATNQLDFNTRYWHKKTKSDGAYVACETLIYYEHKAEVEELLKTDL